MDNKIYYRKNILKKLNAIDSITKQKWDESLFNQFINSDFLKENNVFAIYYSKKYEPDTKKIIKFLLANKKKVCIPRMNKNSELDFYYINKTEDLIIDNNYEIFQPKENKENLVKPKDIEIIVIPAIGIDKNKFRLGHGKGFYDKFLIKNNSLSKKICLIYPIQLIKNKSLIIDKWDQKISNIFIA